MQSKIRYPSYVDMAALRRHTEGKGINDCQILHIGVFMLGAFASTRYRPNFQIYTQPLRKYQHDQTQIFDAN